MAPTPFAVLGDAAGALLCGPNGQSDYATHRSLYPTVHSADSNGLYSALSLSGLAGKGGAGFPVATKLETLVRAPGDPLIIINASESEPLSYKDQTLLWYRPHLIFDGAVLLARMAGASDIVVHMHKNDDMYSWVVRELSHYREAVGGALPRMQVVQGQAHYVSGEASAVASFLAGGKPLPLHRDRPLAYKGPANRPTLVQNAETAAHIAYLAQFGAEKWRSFGEGDGPTLLTLMPPVSSGAVSGNNPLVVERVGRVLYDDVARAATGGPYYLVGGLAGTWVRGLQGGEVSAQALRSSGASLGCGYIGAVAPHQCPLTTHARVVSYLTSERAGQCGPCTLGLPVLSELTQELLEKPTKRLLRKLSDAADEVDGRGACAHPDAVAHLSRSAITALAPVIDAHRGGACELVHEAAWVMPELTYPFVLGEW